MPEGFRRAQNPVPELFFFLLLLQATASRRLSLSSRGDNPDLFLPLSQSIPGRTAARARAGTAGPGAPVESAVMQTLEAQVGPQEAQAPVRPSSCLFFDRRIGEEAQELRGRPEETSAWLRSKDREANSARRTGDPGSGDKGQRTGPAGRRVRGERWRRSAEGPWLWAQHAHPVQPRRPVSTAASRFKSALVAWAVTRTGRGVGGKMPRIYAPGSHQRRHRAGAAGASSCAETACGRPGNTTATPTRAWTPDGGSEEPRRATGPPSAQGEGKERYREEEAGHKEGGERETGAGWNAAPGPAVAESFSSVLREGEGL